MNVLIVGIDSLIGGALAHKLCGQGHRIIGTSRRNNQSDALYFDLQAPCEKWPKWPENIDIAFIAASITQQNICEENPEHAHFINVEQMLKLITQLQQRGIHILYPSTNIVLSCDEPNQPITAPLGPLGVYAQHKAEIETALQNRPNITIVRLPKILNDENSILKDWQNKLNDGEQITAFNNLIISPVSLNYAIEFLAQLIIKKPQGTWHISGAGECSYADLAYALCKITGHNPDKVTPHHAKDLSSATPKHPSLDCSITEKEFGICAQPLMDVIKDCYDPQKYN